MPSTERFSDVNWLSPEQKSNEFFFVIDNTEWPEILGYPESYKPLPSSSNDFDIQVTIEQVLNLTSNDKYTAWTFMFSVLLFIFGGLLIVSICLFSHAKYRYSYKAKERKMIKRQLEMIKDSEYSDFLMLERDKLKHRYSSNSTNQGSYE